MYPKFIELHEKGDAISVNIEHLVAFSNRIFHLSNNAESNYRCDESYDELKALITDVGCLIHKADPRLDLTHPLTLDDLRDMVGEPVWNSNLDRWELVTMVTDFFCKTCHTGQYAGEYSEDDLIKTPLYRMRRA
jgi:hypothetical protein